MAVAGTSHATIVTWQQVRNNAGVSELPNGPINPPEHGPEYILVLSCADQVGIVHAVTGKLARHDATITESQQFEDPFSRTFFMRVRFRAQSGAIDVDALRGDLTPVASHFRMWWDLHDVSQPTRALIMVSQAGHCLADLLHRCHAGTLNMRPMAIVSNHIDLASQAAWHQLPFHHVPITPQTRDAAEDTLLDLIEHYDVRLVILARYMQVLSDRLTQRLPGQVINIHHSFLPGFKGGRPYQQAHARGVKLIGATAHYVTEDLDEGPIIEQDVARVNHSYTPRDLAVAGQDVEAHVLARAVRWHTEHRVFLNGNSTVVLR